MGQDLLASTVLNSTAVAKATKILRNNMLLKVLPFKVEATYWKMVKCYLTGSRRSEEKYFDKKEEQQVINMYLFQNIHYP
jgi:hypothetical protein